MSTVGAPADERRVLAARLAQEGRLAESLPLWREEAVSAEDGAIFVRAAAVEAMAWRKLDVAGSLAQIYTASRWASSWWPGPDAPDHLAVPVPARPPRTQLSAPKLAHDIEQLGYLRDHGVAGAGPDGVGLDGLIDDYAAVLRELAPHGPEARFPMTDEAERAIGHAYNRIVHLAHAPRVERALGSGWDRADVEERYLTQPPGLVVIDGFLSEQALADVRRFCLESTVWSGTRYREGRLGAFFVDGFNTPLLLQIAEEVRAALPRVIGDRHPLRQLWAFKTAATSTGTANTHADFAAVNLNFWATPTESNLDPGSGGMVVHDQTAPLSWDFRTYNERPDLIDGFLRDRGARAVRVPYRQNRAILFNSDLFHATERIDFRPEYEHRRLNITMLYGDRTDDAHHPSSPAVEALGSGSWRSGALSRTRR
jgi:hypothetical protein